MASDLAYHVQFVKTHPECVDGYVALAKCYRDLAEMDQAAAVLRDAIQIDSDI